MIKTEMLLELIRKAEESQPIESAPEIFIENPITTESPPRKDQFTSTENDQFTSQLKKQSNLRKNCIIEVKLYQQQWCPKMSHFHLINCQLIQVTHLHLRWNSAVM